MHSPTALALLAPLAIALPACSGETDPGASPAPTVTVTESATATATTTATVTATPQPTSSSATSSSPARMERCGDVGFEPGTDAGSFDVEASGVGCQEARRVAASAEGQGGEAFTALGFRCQPQGTTGQLPSVVYACSDASDARIMFRTS